MSDLESRRKALAAEAEVYRQTLKLEIQNIKLYASQSKKKYTGLKAGNQLFTAAAPLLTALFRRSRTGKQLRFFSNALVVWKLISRFAPVAPAAIAAIRARREARTQRRQEH